MNLQGGASVADIQYSKKSLKHMAWAYGKVKLPSVKTCLGAGILGSIAHKKEDMTRAVEAAKSVAGFLRRMEAEAVESDAARTQMESGDAIKADAYLTPAEGKRLLLQANQVMVEHLGKQVVNTHGE